MTITKPTPIITWATPADIAYGTALSTAQLNATATWAVFGVTQTVAGSFDYTPAPGTILHAGSNQTLSLSFTPTDLTFYNSASASITINVSKATPTVAWATPAPITYGTALSAVQLNAATAWTVGGVNGPVAGSFTYTSDAGTILHAGSNQTLSLNFTPTDTTDYNTTSAFVKIDVEKVTPIVTWATPADITYGTALSTAQLNAAAAWTVGGVNGPVAGSFSYTPAAGTVLNAGRGQTLKVNFTATDIIDYNIASASVAINVAKATPTLFWPNPADILYSTALSATQLNATAAWTVGGINGPVAGSFTYTPAAGTILDAGGEQTLSTVFSPSNSANYTAASATAKLTVLANADMSVKIAGPTTGLVGQNLVYTVTATNNGPSTATGVVVTETLPLTPTDVIFVSTSTGVAPDGSGTIRFDPVRLPSGASISYVITVQPTLAAGADSPLINSAQVAANELDTKPSNNNVETATTVKVPVDLAISQFTATPRTLQIGDNLTYTIVVTNNGIYPATTVALTSPLGAGLSYVTGSGKAAPSGTINLQGSSLEASLGTLAPGASATVAFTAIPSLIATLIGSAIVTSSKIDIDTDTSNNSATVSTTVVDRVGTIGISQSDYAVLENAGSGTITVSRANGARGTVTIDYTTVPISATPGLDYTSVSGTLTFPDGITSRTIVIPVLANPYDKRDELVSVVLSNVQTTETLGQAILGTPSTATLTIQDIDPNFNPLIVNGIRWTGTAQSITQFFVQFSKPLNNSTASNPANFALVDVGPDGKYGTIDDSSVAMNVASNPSPSMIVALTPARPLPLNRFFHLWINSGTPVGVAELGGDLVAGDGVTAGTSYTAMLGRGTSLKYYTPSGDQVSLKITGGGIIEDLLSGSGQGITLTVVGAVPHRTVLSGRVRKARGGTGKAYLGSTIWGLGKFGDVRVKMFSPPFQIGQYPFSPGSASLKTSSSQVVTAQPASRSKSASVSRTMDRPFHLFHR